MSRLFKMEVSTIYVLKLVGDKYYVGKTKNFKKRLYDHKNGKGSVWTSLHPYVETVETFEGDDFIEDATVKKYMSIHGIQNVRGGSYVKVKLTAAEISLLEKEIRMASNVCTRCGRDSHYVANCYAKTDINGKSLVKPVAVEAPPELILVPVVEPAVEVIPTIPAPPQNETPEYMIVAQNIISEASKLKDIFYSWF